MSYCRSTCCYNRVANRSQRGCAAEHGCGVQVVLHYNPPQRFWPDNFANALILVTLALRDTQDQPAEVNEGESGKRSKTG